MESINNKRTKTTLIILIATALLIGGAVIVSQQNKSENNKPETNSQKSQPKTTTPNNNETAGMPVSPNGFRDGNYNATGTYQSPGGKQEIKVTINLLVGKIMAIGAEGDNKSSDSRFYQSSFISGYKEKVIGKKIDEVKLDHVGSSSLTPQGFNNALEDIKNQAKA